jgi:predicted transcriptional regulator of viral defense system
MQSDVFFATHPVFTLEEFVRAGAGAGRTRSTAKNLLAKHVAAGRILRVRRGLYASVPVGLSPSRATVDPFLLAAWLADDAVVAYHAALQFHGKSYSVWRRFHYLTDNHRRPFNFRGDEFLPVPTPAAVRSRPDRGGGIEALAHAGGEVRVTTLERTLVDAFDAPERCGGWEEVWRSLEMVEFFDVAEVVEYAALLGSALTAARVGFFLEQHEEELMIEEQQLADLRRMRPRQPRYFDASRAPGRLHAAWNLIVPDAIAGRRWEEPA